MNTLDVAYLHKPGVRIFTYINRISSRYPLTVLFTILICSSLLTILAIFAAVCLVALPLGILV